ncbi:MAG: ATP-binding protein, partial [Candidatus Nanopelagicales bacterium]
RDRLAARAADVTRLRETENARRALLAAVSHDLRTPIAGVKASISTLADEQLELDADDRQSLLEAAERGTDRLSSLVDNLLDMNRLQTGAVRALPRRVVLDEIIQRAITGFPLDTVVSDIGEDLPVIETDPTLLERILANIIENAARQYSHGEPVHVMAGFIAAPVPHIDIRVMDQGPGVRPELRAAMFQPFQQPGDQKQASAGGTGLGLAVAAGLARLIGAVIEAEDTPGTGLTMVVSVPLALPTERGSE